MTISVTVAIVMIVGIGVAVWLSQRSIQRRVLRKMQSRPARSAHEFGRDFFTAEMAETATRVREILARHISVDLSRLSPEDTFIDLEMAELDSMASVEFVVDLEREFHIKISDADAERMKTFRDVVEYVSKAARQPVD
jgi:acyl carrier protein